MDTSQYQVISGGVTFDTIAYVCRPCDLTGEPPLYVGPAALSLHDQLVLATRHDAEHHAVDVRFPLLVVEGT